MNQPLVSRELPDKAQISTPGGAAETAADRIASSSQLYFAHVPMLQDSYLFGVADWYSLVTTLLNSHWDSITDAHDEPGAQEDGQQNAPRWMSWAWLQTTLEGLSAEHRQVQHIT